MDAYKGLTGFMDGCILDNSSNPASNAGRKEGVHEIPARAVRGGFAQNWGQHDGGNGDRDQAKTVTTAGPGGG